MGRGGFVGLLLAVLIVTRGSCYSLGDIVRVLSSEGDHQVEPAKIEGGSPSPSPLPVVKKGSVNGTSEEKKQSQPDGGAKSGSSGGDQVGKHDSTKKTADGEKGGGAELKDKNGDNKEKTSSDPPQGKKKVEEDCGSSAYCSCNDQHGLIACLRRGEPGKVYILVKNDGDTKLNVNIKVPPSMHISNATFQLEKHHYEKVNVSFKNHFNPQIVLDAGNEECLLQPGMLFSAGSILQNLPYTVTPAYGAYALLLTTVIAGGVWACVWACCKFRKRTRRSGDGVPYRELEMGIPQSSTAIDVDTVEGWDEGWDDDWDDRPVENSSDGQIRSPSENGLSSRSSKKDKWDKDWDD